VKEGDTGPVKDAALISAVQRFLGGAVVEGCGWVMQPDDKGVAHTAVQSPVRGGRCGRVATGRSGPVGSGHVR